MSCRSLPLLEYLSASARRGNDRKLTRDLPSDTRRDHIVIGDTDMVVPRAGSASFWQTRLSRVAEGVMSVTYL